MKRIRLSPATVGASIHAAFVLTGAMTAPAAPAQPPPKPNVLSLAIDDLNHWVGYLGRNPQTKTPIWSDHGWHLGEKQHWRKFALWEEATHAPFIWVVPGLTQPNRRCDRTVDFMSIYPTLCDLCGIPTPAHVQGESIRPLLTDPQAPRDKPALTTYRYMNHAVRTEGWRYIRYANGDEELYDELKDPHEWANLATQPDFTARKAALATRLPTENQPDIGNSPAKRGKGGAKSKAN